MIRVRFAPSPTGFLHIGGARTALFNWLFARNQGGKFILRIEDTDVSRSRKEYLDDILAALEWLGLDWNEGPYFQTEHLSSYRKYAEKLLSAGMAYREPGPEGKGEAIKFKVPGGLIKFSDLIHGEVAVDSAILDDIVLLKSDGYPAYNFACVVDDTELKITQVIRGDDHLSNTPKQILLYGALGLNPPQYAHIPLIMGEGGGRLSKREGADSVTSLREAGYLSDGVVNYLALLGWSPKDNREIISREEMVKEFSLGAVKKSAAAFGWDKLNWLNGQYLRRLPLPELKKLIVPCLEKAGYSTDDRRLEAIIRLYLPRMEKASDFLPWTEFLFSDELKFDEDAEACLKEKSRAEVFSEFSQRLSALAVFDKASIENCLRGLAEEKGIKAAELIHPTRAALTGKTKGAGLFEVVELLGKEKTLVRLNELTR